jgi:IPT/TIG domain
VQVIAGSNYLRKVNLPANALLGGPGQQVVYAAIAASAANNPDNVVAIAPDSGKVVASQAMPGEPTLLAISDDQQYLYVGMTAIATIARLKLPSLTPDIQWTVGPVPSPNYAVSLYSMQVAPSRPHTIAVAQANPNNPGATELAIYDDGIRRPDVAVGVDLPNGDMDILQWSADASTIYGAERTESGGPEFIYSINAQGAALVNVFHGALDVSGSQLYFDRTKARLYDLAGEVVDATTGKLMGTFPSSGSAFALDPGQRRAYFLGGPAFTESLGYVDAGSGPEITVYDQDSLTSEGTIVLPSANSGAILIPPQASYLVRWGDAGLAFNMADAIYLLDGPFVTAGALPSSAVGTYATPPPRLSGLSPEWVVAGSQDVLITLSGQNFTPATTVNWRDNSLATKFVDNTQVQAVIPAAALNEAASAPLYVQNSPGEGISNLVVFSVLPQLGGGLQLAALNISGTDLAWNATSNELYVAVANTDATHPGSIATLDPAAATLLSVLPLNANPYVLAISGDDQKLYVGFTDNANIRRYALPGLNPDLLIPLGIGDPFVSVAGTFVAGGADSCAFAVSLAVAPGENSTVAVAQGAPGSSSGSCGATAVIDGMTPRPVTPPIYTTSGYDFSKLSWGADDTVLFAQGSDDVSSQPIYSLSVSSAGVSFHQSDDTDIYLGYRPHFDAMTGLIYSDGGAVTQPSTLKMVGNFQASGLMVPDSSLGLAYFLGRSASSGGQGYALQIYDLKTYALLNSIPIPNIIGFPIQMVRWGPSGIAFTTVKGDSVPGLTYLLSGPALSSPNAAVKPGSKGIERVQFTWREHLLAPQDAAAGMNSPR